MLTTTSPGRCLSALVLLFAAGAVIAADIGTVKRYIACPVYRDTDAGRKSGCWLATELESGERYDVGNSLNKPYVGRLMLVEGVVAKGPDVCGAAVLEPVRVSVLTETCPEIIFPAEGHPGRPSTLPAEIVMPLEVPRKTPPPPYAPRDFHVLFDYRDDFITYQHGDVAIEKAWIYASAAKARRVIVSGFADTRGFAASGRQLKEPAALAQSRADIVAEALRRLGVPAESISVRTSGNPQPVITEPGMHDISKRRVTVTVEP